MGRKLRHRRRHRHTGGRSRLPGSVPVQRQTHQTHAFHRPAQAHAGRGTQAHRVASHGPRSEIAHDARATAGLLISSVKVATRMWIVDPEAGYAIVKKEGKELDVVAGVRIWNLDNSVTLFAPNFAVERGSGTRSLANPVVGAAFSSDVGQKMFVFGKADIGTSTDWQAFGGGGYKFNNTIVGTVGYRSLSIDHSSSNSVFDVHLNGVIVGLGFRF